MTIVGNGVVTLTSGEAGCAIMPRAGGAVAAFWWDRDGRRVDWLRPATPGVAACADGARMACRPLIPYASRMREGGFAFCGRAVIEAPPAGERPALHGRHGWRREWMVRERGEERLVLDYVHEPGDWPWTYRARQSFVLTPEMLRLTLEIENLSEALMPAGLGFRPCFPRRPDAVVAVPVSGVWLTDSAHRPTEKTAVPPAWDLAQGRRIADVALDNVFTGWSGGAVVTWPELGGSLALEAGQPLLSFLAVEAQPEEESFCLGPVSHCSDAVSLARAGVADTGLRVLAPGASRSAVMTLRPKLG